MMGFFGAAHGWGRGKKLPQICQAHPTMMKLGTVIPYLKRSKKYMNHMSRITYIKKYRCRLNFNTYFLILLICFESFKIVLINMVIILMMSGKMAIVGLLERKLFWNKGYEVSVYDVTNNILSRDSKRIVDVAHWTKFCNSSISRRKVIITSMS